jgi:Zn-dependent M28 family amino/carboxypeptidase
VGGVRRIIAGRRWQEQYQAKVQQARQKGARQVFLIDEAGEIFGKSWPEYANYARQAQLGFGEEKGSPALFLSLSAAARVLGVSENELVKEASRLARERKPRIREVPAAKWSLVVRQANAVVETENVLGLVEGTDRKEEVLVITAHYDHLGKKGEVVYNGANDDGSGTVAVLELAQAFATARAEGRGPRRSILFMTVIGEEKGLLGSQYYTEHPAIPLKNTIANLNIDMIGRVDNIHQGVAGSGTVPDYIYLNLPDWFG